MKGINDSSSSPHPLPHIEENRTQLLNTTCNNPSWTIQSSSSSHLSSNIPYARTSTELVESRNEDETTSTVIPRDDFSALLDSYFQQDSSSYKDPSAPFTTTAAPTEVNCRASCIPSVPMSTQPSSRRMVQATATTSTAHTSTLSRPSQVVPGTRCDVFSTPSTTLPPPSATSTLHKSPTKASSTSSSTTQKRFSGLWSFLYSIHQHEQRVFHLLCQSSPQDRPLEETWPQIQSCMAEYQRLYPPLIEYLKNTRKLMKTWEQGLKECKEGVLWMMKTGSVDDTMIKEGIPAASSITNTFAETTSSPSSSNLGECLDTIYQQVYALRVEYDCIQRMVEEYPKSSSHVWVPPPSVFPPVYYSLAADIATSSDSTKNIHTGLDPLNVDPRDERLDTLQRKGEIYTQCLRTKKKDDNNNNYEDVNEKLDEEQKETLVMVVDEERGMNVNNRMEERPVPTTPPPTPQGILYPPCSSLSSLNRIIHVKNTHNVGALSVGEVTTPLLVMPSPYLGDFVVQQQQHDDPIEKDIPILFKTRNVSYYLDDNNMDPRNNSNKAMSMAINKTTTKVNPNKKKRKKDKTLPKRPLSAYNLFFCDQRGILLNEMTMRGEEEQHNDINEDNGLNLSYDSPLISNDFPSNSTTTSMTDMCRVPSSSSPIRRPHRKTHGKISFQDLAKIIGHKWQHLNVEEKSRYEQRAQEEKERYFQIKWELQQQQQKQKKQLQE